MQWFTNSFVSSLVHLLKHVDLPHGSAALPTNIASNFDVKLLIPGCCYQTHQYQHQEQIVGKVTSTWFLPILCPFYFDLHHCCFWTLLLFVLASLCALYICTLIFLDCMSCCTSLLCIIAICQSSISLVTPWFFWKRRTTRFFEPLDYLFFLLDWLLLFSDIKCYFSTPLIQL